jgi:hypothetical protein
VWSSSLQLLRHPEASVRFFGATLLHQKVLAAWTLAPQQGGLTPDQQRQMMGEVLAAMRAAAEANSRPVAQQLGRTMLRMAVRVPNGISDLISSLLPSSQVSITSGQAFMLLDALAGVTEEVTKLHAGNFTKIENLSAQLRQQTDLILTVVRGFLTEALQSSQVGSLVEQIAKCVTVLRDWRMYGADLVHLHEMGLLTLLGHCYTLGLRHPALLESVTELLEDGIEHPGVYPRHSARDQVVDIVIEMLLSARETYQRLVQQCVATLAAGRSDDDELAANEQVCYQFARLAAWLAGHEIDYLACHPDSSSSSSSGSEAPKESHRHYFEFMMAMTQHPYDLRIVEATLDGWADLQGTTVSARKFDFLQKEVFVVLLQSLLKHMAYPPSFVDWKQPLTIATAQDAYFRRIYADDADAYRKFRAGLLEVCLATQGALRSQYLDTIVPLLQAQQWQQLEVAFLALTFISAEVHSLYSEDCWPLEEKTHARGVLDLAMQRVWALAPESGVTAPRLLLQAGCAMIKQYSFAVKYTEPQQAQQTHLEQNILYLLRVIPATQTTGQLQTKSQNECCAAQDADNVSGVAFLSLCRSPHSRLLLIRSPQMLSTVAKLMCQQEGFAEKITEGMRILWLQGFAQLVLALAYSDDSVANLNASMNNSMNMAASYLREVTAFSITALEGVFTTLSNLQAQHGGSYTPSPSELTQIRSTVVSHLRMLSAVTDALCNPDPDMLQCKEQLNDGVAALRPGFPKPSSFALHFFGSLWPFLQQIVGMFTPVKDAEVLEEVVKIYTGSIVLLYAHELETTLEQVLSSSLRIYSTLALPGVLHLISKAVSTFQLGARVELRDMWCTIIGQVYKLTMNNTKENFKAHTEVFEAFFRLCESLYTSCTYCLLTAPSNALTHILQFCVQVLDSIPENRAVISVVLSFLATLLDIPMEIDLLPEKNELHHRFKLTYEEQGGGLIRQLCVNLTSPLPAGFSRQIPRIFHRSLTRFPEETHQWITKAIMSDYFAASATHLTEEDRQLFLAIMWPLFLNSDKQQFTSVFDAFHKVCLGEDDMEAIRSFQLINKANGSGKVLRGSKRADDAFASI